MDNDGYVTSTDDTDSGQEGHEEGNVEEQQRQTEFDSPPPGGRECIIYKPTFRDEMLAQATTTDDMEKLHKDFLKRNWLTEGLSKETLQHGPKDEDIK